MLNFAAILRSFGERAAFRLANAARPAGNLLFNSLLPERSLPTFHIEGGSITIRSTMAGLVGMDSPYPPGGMITASSFSEETAKLANEVVINEAVSRQLMQVAQMLGQGSTASNEALSQNVLNFLNKMIIQPHLDVMEWLRAKALVTGAIDWTFNQKRLLVDYGVPAANFLTARTGNDGYGGSASKFWTDVTLLRRALKRGGVRAFIAHPDTIDMIKYNLVNQLQQVGGEGSTFVFRRWVRNDSGASLPGTFSQASDDTITMIAYAEEGEVINPAAPETTIILPFMPTGKILAVGNNRDSGFRVGDGSTPDPEATNALGYTHLGPTIEGGAPGRWADLYTPENTPWALHGRGVTNGLPVITAPEKIAVSTTDMV